MPKTEDDSPLMVFTTLPNEIDAKRLVQELLERRLIACGTILPAQSVYRWEGQLHSEPEALVMLKSRQGRWDALEAAVTQSHPYDVPELLAVPATTALPAYARWINDETTEQMGDEA